MEWKKDSLDFTSCIWKAKQMLKNPLRKQIEKCDSFEGLTVFSGWTGACGSGVTSAISEMMSKDCPKNHVMYQALWPD